MIAENLGVISGDANNRFIPTLPYQREIALMIFKAGGFGQEILDT
jgi:hypothetical protein